LNGKFFCKGFCWKNPACQALFSAIIRAVGWSQAAVHNKRSKVLAVLSNGVVIVSLGSNQGFKSGDKLLLYQTVDTKDDKGEVVFTEEKVVGEVTFEVVQEDRSKASYTGDVEVKAGWVVRAK
jgi:hypothetical protein